MVKKKKKLIYSEKAQLPWHKKIGGLCTTLVTKFWLWVTALMGVLAWILLQGPTALQNARVIPSEVETTKNIFLSWFYDDSAWSGTWTSTPEGYVHTQDLKLSDSDLKFILHSEQGEIRGVAASNVLCKAMPLHDYLLVEGSVEFDSDEAILEVFDYIGGSRKSFTKVNLKKEGDVLIVSPIRGDNKMLQNSIRIASDPSLNEEESYNLLSGFCKNEKELLMEKLAEIKAQSK